MIIHNTLGQKDEEFQTLHSGRINIFVCGPTVYDDTHIGHARTNIFFDVIAKFLRLRGYSVFYLQNITDIDDKIINRGKEENVSFSEIADRYYNQYLNVMKMLKINSVNYYARASLYINEIISQIKRMMDSGIAYTTPDGVYFNVRKFEDYGKLSNQNIEEMKTNARGIINEKKNDPLDFVLWKSMKPGEPYWDSPWGKGRPGWHIEDTAITEAWFGSEYDIHGGGSDLIFPHHEAEIAQMRSISGKKYLARYWIHTGMLNINDEKMSKSLKNFIKTSELLKKYRAEYIRYAMVNSNYNTVINFSDELMNDAVSNVDKINILYKKLKDIKKEEGSYHIDANNIINKINSIMENNFDTRGVIRELLEFVSTMNKNLELINIKEAYNAIKVIDHVNYFLCILYSNIVQDEKLVDILLDLRKKLRMEKNYELSDYIRNELEKLNIYIEDKNNSSTWLIKN